MNLDTVVCADALDFLRTLPDESVNCLITSPPYYGLRDYGEDGQLGLEDTPAEYVARMVAIFREARRVLRDDGTCWIVIGDSYWGGKGQSGHADPEMQMVRVASGVSFNAPAAHVGGHGQTRPTDRKHETLKPKDLIGIPWRVAFALQADGWWLRSDIIWAKPNPMPESVRDRPTKAHEYVFLLTRSATYWYDAEAIVEPAIMKPQNRNTSGRGKKDIGYAEHRKAPGMTNPITRNCRTIWTVATEPTPFAHFATFPQKLIEPMVLAGCPAGGVVCDPFMGSGTTALVARQLGRHFLGCDVNAEYVALANERLAVPYTLPMFV